MFIRKNKNRKGGFSIQLVQKIQGKYQLIKTIGTGNNTQEIEFLFQKARQELHHLGGAQTLFVSKDDAFIESFLLTGDYSKIDPPFADNNIMLLLVRS